MNRRYYSGQIWWSFVFGFDRILSLQDFKLDFSLIRLVVKIEDKLTFYVISVVVGFDKNIFSVIILSTKFINVHNYEIITFNKNAKPDMRTILSMYVKNYTYRNTITSCNTTFY